MIDWSKYPLADHTRRYLSAPHREELDRLVSDVRRAERKRCAAMLLEAGKVIAEYRDCAHAIEAMGDDDG